MNQHRHSHFIGMFDSGMGGLTVLKEVKKLLPLEKFIYFGDTARMPYGGKSAETVLRYSIENAIFLLDQNIKILINACNTSSAVSISKLEKIFNIPVIGVIEPGAKQAISTTKNGNVAVLATTGTIQSKAYQEKIRALNPDINVYALECPLLASIVEEGMHDHLIAELLLREYLKPILNTQVDTVLLGCTHYPPLKPLLEKILGPNVKIVDSAVTCAETLKDTLALYNLENISNESVCHQYFVSDNPEKFKRLASFFMQETPLEVSLKAIN